MNRTFALVLLMALVGCSRSTASPEAKVQPQSIIDKSLFAGDNPKPGLTIHLDESRTIAFLPADEPNSMRWVISSPIPPPPGNSSVSSISAEAGFTTETSIYQWNPATQTFWFGRRTIVQRETLIPAKDVATSRTDGGMWSVTGVDSLTRIENVPPEFMEKMKGLVDSSNHP